MNEESLMAQVEKCGIQARLLYFVQGFVKGRRSTYSRGYLEFFSPRDAEAFHVAFMQKWDVPSKVSPCVEPSTFQKIPRGIERPDSESGKLEEYEPFQKFLQELNSEKVTLPSADVQLERRQQSGEGDKKEPIISPLLRDVMEKKMQQLERDRKEMLNKQRSKGRQGSKQSGSGGNNNQSQKGSSNQNKRGPRRQRNRKKKTTE